MKLRCPACGAEFDWEAAVRDRDQEELVRAAAAFGADWFLISEYLNGFRLRPDAALGLTKRVRLAREVWQMWEHGKFALGGQWYTVGRQEFREALRQVANRELTGLKNHNYLKQVLTAAARKTSARLERELRQKEQGMMVGREAGMAGGDACPTPLPELEEIPGDPEWRAELKRLGRAVRQPGLDPQEREKRAAALKVHLETTGQNHADV